MNDPPARRVPRPFVGRAPCIPWAPRPSPVCRWAFVPWDRAVTASWIRCSAVAIAPTPAPPRPGRLGCARGTLSGPCLSASRRPGGGCPKGLLLGRASWTGTAGCARGAGPLITRPRAPSTPARPTGRVGPALRPLPRGCSRSSGAPSRAARPPLVPRLAVAVRHCRGNPPTPRCACEIFGQEKGTFISCLFVSLLRAPRRRRPDARARWVLPPDKAPREGAAGPQSPSLLAR